MHDSQTRWVSYLSLDFFVDVHRWGLKPALGIHNFIFGSLPGSAEIMSGNCRPFILRNILGVVKDLLEGSASHQYVQPRCVCTGGLRGLLEETGIDGVVTTASPSGGGVAQRSTRQRQRRQHALHHGVTWHHSGHHHVRLSPMALHRRQCWTGCRMWHPFCSRHESTAWGNACSIYCHLIIIISTKSTLAACDDPHALSNISSIEPFVITQTMEFYGLSCTSRLVAEPLHPVP